jgi:hypothetical protein
MIVVRQWNLLSWKNRKPQVVYSVWIELNCHDDDHHRVKTMLDEGTVFVNCRNLQMNWMPMNKVVTYDVETWNELGHEHHRLIPAIAAHAQNQTTSFSEITVC